MTKLHRILTAIDFSAPARAAFDHALALSRLHDAELLAVHAVPADRRFNWHARERIALIAALRDAAATAGVRFKVSVQHGDPAGVILLHADARQADLIVLGSGERSRLDRFRFGSVAETVAVKASVPVLVVPPASVKVAEPGMPFKNILVAIDFGDGSSEAVERALAMANGNSRVTVMHVVQGVPLGSAPGRLSHRMESEYQRRLVDEAWQRLPEIIPANARASRTVHARVVTGDPSTAIGRVAVESDADLILLGVTARGAIGRMLFGSTAARVIRTSGHAVMAIPRPSKPKGVLTKAEGQFAAAA